MSMCFLYIHTYIRCTIQYIAMERKKISWGWKSFFKGEGVFYIDVYICN